MTRRTKEHELEACSRDHLTTLFHRQGWTLETIHSDYGEDLLVRIFESQRATPWIFFVQIKAFSDTTRLRIRSGTYLSIPVDAAHIDSWSALREPVVLVVWDAAAGVFYWQTIQNATAVAARRSELNGTPVVRTRVWVPCENILDDVSAERLANRARSAWEQIDREREGAQLLIHSLREQLGLDIAYDPQYGTIRIPRGNFVPEQGRGSEIYCFGRAARDVGQIAQRLHISPQEALTWTMSLHLAALRRITAGEAVEFRAPDGSLVREWRDADDVTDEIFHMYEQSDED